MKLGIGIVTSAGYAHTIPTEFVWSLWALHSRLLSGETPVKRNVLIKSEKFPTDVARNEIVRQALAERVDRLLFLDGDHQFSPENVLRLLDHDVDIVTGRYHVKRPPFHPNLYLTPKGPHVEGDFKTVHYGRGVFPVDRCGAGCLLITQDVLEAIGDPWFRYGVDPRPPHDLGVSEDFYFCERAQACGYTIWADWDAELEHLTSGSVSGTWYTEYLKSVEREIANGKPELADNLVVCGYPDGYDLPSGQHVDPYVR